MESSCVAEGRRRRQLVANGSSIEERVVERKCKAENHGKRISFQNPFPIGGYQLTDLCLSHSHGKAGCHNAHRSMWRESSFHTNHVDITGGQFKLHSLGAYRKCQRWRGCCAFSNEIYGEPEAARTIQFNSLANTYPLPAETSF